MNVIYVVFLLMVLLFVPYFRKCDHCLTESNVLVKFFGMLLCLYAAFALFFY